MRKLIDKQWTRWMVGPALCAALLGSGCEDEGNPMDNGWWFPRPMTTSDAGSDAASPLADAGGQTGSDGSVVEAPDAGALTDGGGLDTDASTPSEAGTDAGGTSVDASTDSDASGNGGPVALPSPNDPGPYTVIEEDNVGMGFENPINSSDVAPGGFYCELFIGLFDASKVETYAPVPTTYNMALYTLYRPEPAAPGQKFPVLSWANGTCAHTVGYADMIKHVVSHGFIVIAPHSRFTGSGQEQIRGVDWVLAQNEVATSPLFGHVNKDSIGIFGHSQGGGSTGIAGADPRVDTSILMHGGNGTRLMKPAFFLTGENDNPTGVRAAYDGTSVPAAFGNLADSNHITMMTEAPRMAPEVTAWFRYQLLGDTVSRGWFVGADCLLCKDPEWTYASKNLQ